MSRIEIADDFLERPYALDVREASLVERLQANEDAAYEELFRTYRDPVARIVYRMLGDSPEASDVLQEIFLKVFRNIRSFRGDSSLRTWIFRIAVSEILNRLRWWRRKFRSVADRFGDSRSHTAFGPSPHQALEAKERDTIIRAGLGRLSREHKSILVLRDIEGFSYIEISEVLGISIGTVKSRLARARADLRKTLLPYL